MKGKKRKLSGNVAEHARLVQAAFQAQLQYIQLASESSQPGQSQVMNLLKPTSEKISAIQDYREKHRTSPFFNHLSAISESISALGWVTVSPAPSPYVKEMNDAGQFYTNRVLKEWKEKEKKHVDWVKAWLQTLTELQAFVKQHHTTGLVWSGKGAPKAGGVPPPPPPGCPPPPPVVDFSAAAAGDAGMVKDLRRLRDLNLKALNLNLIEPRTFQNLPGLEMISLVGNRLTTIQKDVFNVIPSLVNIDLSTNQIETIEDGAFADMPNLAIIYLEYNNIARLNGNIFYGSPRIYYLKLDHNKIRHISKISFNDLRAIRNISNITIILSNNKIEDIDSEAFKEMVPVFLDLGQNSIAHISENLFSLQKASVVNLSKNLVRYVTDEVLQWIGSNNITVLLYDNPVDCYYKETLKHIMSKEDIPTYQFQFNSTLSC